ncbi:hypothetical protein HPP92_016627 [Vanilla planifolia]|uniref:Uncharacterized protein n=1 Tax=Vanilla planifolia TaxID=51239 RepID=A0A835QJJ1_VANPL|nr:hypothetical protein HPP92_016627 [Vanilla planifolia]
MGWDCSARAGVNRCGVSADRLGRGRVESSMCGSAWVDSVDASCNPFGSTWVESSRGGINEEEFSRISNISRTLRWLPLHVRYSSIVRMDGVS